MRDFKKLPGAGPGNSATAIPADQVISDSTDPERAAHLLSVAPGGVHLTPLHPVYLGGNPDTVKMLNTPARNTSRVKRVGR